MKEEQKGYIELILFSLFNGLVGVVVKLTHNINATSIVFFRAVIASVSLFIFMMFVKKLRELRFQDPLNTILVGAFQGFSILLYFLALQKTSVSNALFLIYTAPIFSVFLARIFLKEHIERKTLIGLLFSIVGIVCILDPKAFTLDSSKNIGNLFALGSGFLYAAMALIAKPLLKKVSGYYTVFWQYVVISMLFLFLLRGSPMSEFGMNWWQLSVIGTVCTAIAFTLFMEGVKKVKAQKIFIITSLEPLVGTLAALFILQEIPTLLTIIGAVLIFTGVYFVTLHKR